MINRLFENNYAASIVSIAAIAIIGFILWSHPPKMAPTEGLSPATVTAIDPVPR